MSAVRSTVIAADGALLHVEVWGSGQPVVCCHAWGLSSRMWDAQIPRLVAAGKGVVLMDRRGHGRSELTSDGYDLDTSADDLYAVVSALGLTDMVLVGHSAGAQQLLRYLSRHGTDRSAAVVLSAPVTPCLIARADFPGGLPEAMFEGQRTQWLEDFGAWIDASADAYFGTATVSASLRDTTKRMLMDTPLSVILETHCALSRADLRSDLAALTLPTTVIHGTADASAPLALTGQPTVAILHNGRLVEIEGAGHGLYAGHESRYNSALLAAITQLS